MGQSASLCEVKELEFQRLIEDPSCFEFKMALRYEAFEQNFEGLLFLLSKSFPAKEKTTISSIFFPPDFLDRSVDSATIEIDDIEKQSISFHPIDNVVEIKNLLAATSKAEFLSNYNSKELNENGVYPGNWHDDESPDKAFNKAHLEEGFDALRSLFQQAANNGSYLLAFVG